MNPTLNPIRTVALSFMLIAPFANAKDDKKNQPRELISYLEESSQLTGQRYVYSRLVDGRTASLSSNIVMTKENAEQLITNILLMNDLTRVPTGEPNTYYIVEAKNAIQSPIPVFEASLKIQPTLPNTHDMISVKYTAVDKDMAQEVQRFLTDLLPRYGRVTTYPDSSVLLITDSAQNIRRVIDVLRSVDRPMSAEAKKSMRERLNAIKKRNAQTPATGNS